MKLVVIILFSFITITAYSQSAPLDSIFYTRDTLIKFKGIDTIPHQHNYVSSELGNGDNWKESDIICVVCLRNCQTIESWINLKRGDPYQQAKQRLKQYFKTQN